MRPDEPAEVDADIPHPYRAGPYPRALVHRGWQLGELAGMENSMASFRRALAEGFRYLEIDVHATSDGVVVVAHDATLDRTTDAVGPIAEQPWERVRRARVGGREPVTSLRAVIEELPNALLNIDVKAGPAVRPTLELLAETDAWRRVCLASFSAVRLARLRRGARARVLTSCSPADALALRIDGWLRQARVGRVGGLLPVPAQLAQLPRRQGPLTVVEPALIEAAHRRGMEVHVWTVNDPAEMRELLDMGVDGLVTDRPDRLREVLAERGQWRG
ncbi:glycerophosphodiester phosphodiesterase family protein [Pseudonocardia acaciae]|uniref:glycerophosphodiester phosphodiesterase family protein n=1 Tax=Pseudonocardia acaciae TaxID=551276 RepID=UPI001FE1AB01|nr:glycerophosphodiester phosphodiesterase family protein [Pseudonocardia acaciae]